MLIGVIGKKQSGKDTLADYLCNKYDFVKYSFADPLKKGVKEFFGFNDNQLWGDQKEIIDERWGVTPREVLQIFGSEITQFQLPNLLPNFKFGRELWVKRFEYWYEDHNDLNVVIPDCRFIHEINSIKSKGGIIIRVNRELDNTNFSNHISENEWMKALPDFIIANNSSIENYQKIIDQVMTEIKP
jgi:hypothetical protein